MSQKSLAQEYAQAVYALALEDWQKSLLAVQEKLAGSPEALSQLSDMQTPFAKRQEQLDRLLPDDLPEHVRNFFYTLLKNGDLSLLADVAKHLTRLARRGPGVEVATVTTAVPLTDQEKAQFQQKLAARHREELEIDFVVDKRILGGAIVQVGDQIIDGSVASKLNAAQERLNAT